MAQPLIAALKKLLDADTPLFASQLTLAQRRHLDTVRQKIGGIACQLHGNSIRYQLTDRQRILNYLRHLQPETTMAEHANLPQRAQNIGQSRHSKSGQHAHQSSYVLLKSISENVIWQQQQQSEQQQLKLTELTTQYGVAALKTHPDDTWSSQQPLWLIENQALFDQLDWLPSDATGSLLYYAGQLPNRLLDWLAATPRYSTLILFADYDGVGFSNFVRLKQRCPDAKFWLMPHWQDKIVRYGNKEIWQNTHADFVRAYGQLLQQATGQSDTALQKMENDHDVLVLCQQLQQHGLALEQEAVWW